MNNRWIYFIFGFVLGMLAMWALLLLPGKAEAGTDKKVWICHCEPTTGEPKKCQSIKVSKKAARWHLNKHDNDYRGKCQTHKECVGVECVKVLGKGDDQCVCDVDCIVCEWSEWEACDVECGWGSQVSYLRGEGCSNEARYQRCFVECEKPIPTPTPDSDPEPAPPVSPNTFRTEATCNGIMPTAPVCTVGHFTDGDSAFLGWWKYNDSADKLMLRYGYSPDNLMYGVDSIPVDSEGLEVNGVDTSGHIYYQLLVDRDECVVASQICDP